MQLRNGDTLQRFLFEHTNVRGELVHLDATWQAVLGRHEYPPVVRDLLGEAMAACALLSATIKFQGSLILQIRGEGPLTMLVVQVSRQRTLRGMVDWEGEVQPGPLKELFGEGCLTITIDPGVGMERYQGVVDLGDRGLTEALEGYFERSEQLATRLWLAADGRRAAGLLLQKVPGDTADEDAWGRVVQLGQTISSVELTGLPSMEILRRLYHEEDVRVFEPEPVSFRCGCSRARIEETLRGLGHREVRSILEEQGKVSVDCSFCKQNYQFDAIDVEQMFAAVASPQMSKTRH